MSGAPTPEDIGAAKLRDRRFLALDLGLEIEAETRRGRPLAMILEALREDADRAMTEFATANCGDTNLIMGLQSRVFRFRFAIETFSAIIDAGRSAGSSLISEDQLERERID